MKPNSLFQVAFSAIQPGNWLGLFCTGPGTLYTADAQICQLTK